MSQLESCDQVTAAASPDTTVADANMAFDASAQFYDRRVAVNDAR